MSQWFAIFYVLCVHVRHFYELTVSFPWSSRRNTCHVLLQPLVKGQRKERNEIKQRNGKWFNVRRDSMQGHWCASSSCEIVFTFCINLKSSFPGQNKLRGTLVNLRDFPRLHFSSVRLNSKGRNVLIFFTRWTMLATVWNLFMISLCSPSSTA
jgi:hypothetical protein